jgi:hypothetical protein
LNGVSVPNGVASLIAQNPLEFDGSTPATDMYMFEERDANGNITKHGYISTMSENKSPVTTISPDGRSASVSLDSALRIETASLSTTFPDTQTTFAFDRMSCSATDNR